MDLKWGVLTTAVIEKEQVTEYIYYKTQFENMIEGCEEIKAYVYEAARFQRVDLPMYDGNTYHSIYMQTPKMWNWTKTHGGPYYVEVGHNLTIQYMETVNVSIPIS